MRCYFVFVVSALIPWMQWQSLLAQTAPLPQNNSVKLRLEVEIRGVLAVTEKSITVTKKETISEWVKNTDRPRPGAPDMVLQSREVDKVWVLELDENQRKMAKSLHEKEVVVTGKCLLLGIKNQANTSKAATIGSRTIINP